MHANTGRSALAALSGFAIVGVLAGCTGYNPHVGGRYSKPKVSFTTATPSATPTETPTPTATHKAKPKPPPVVHIVVPVKPKPKPKPPTTYADGAYTADGNYVSPGGPEEIEVDVTLGGGIITSVAVKTVHADSSAAAYELQFANGIGGVVVGRKISGLSVGVVGGSSLTSQGFNEALSAIRAQAKN